MTMIAAQHNAFIDFMVGRPVSLLMRCVFRSIRIHGQKCPAKGPVLLIANHFSWWDGFIAREVNTAVFKRRLHVMMLEEELSKRPFLRKMGAFSIRRKSRGALQSLNYAAALLDNPDHLLLLFPQGEFQTTHRYPLNFQNGWYRILEKAPQDTQIFFMACLSDFFRHQRPALDIYLRDARQRSGIESEECTKQETGPDIKLGDGPQRSGIEPEEGTKQETGPDINPEDALQRPGIYPAGDAKREAASPMLAPPRLYPDPRAVESAYNAFLLDAIRQQDKKANEVVRD